MSSNKEQVFFPDRLLLSEESFNDILGWATLEQKLLEKASTDPHIIESLRAERDGHFITTLSGNHREYIPGITSYYAKVAGKEYSISESIFKEICEMVQEIGIEPQFENDFDWSSE